MNYFGTPTLVALAKQWMYEWTDEEAEAYGLNHLQTLKLLKSGCHLMPTIAQYDDRFEPSLAETSWMAKIKSLILDGSVYYRLIPSKSWAYPDKQREKNYDIVSSLGFDIGLPSQSEDAVFSYHKPIELKKLYLNSELTPDNPEKIELKLSGVVEFGTQSIPKTAMCLLTGMTLMRVCYKPNHNLGPWISIIHNTKPFTLDFIK